MVTTLYNPAIELKGKIEGKIEDILDLLGEFGEIPEPLEKRIKEQKEIAILSSWLKLAAKVDSIEKFKEKISN